MGQKVRQEWIIDPANEGTVVRDATQKMSTGLGAAQVVGLPWNDVPHTASRVRHIALIPGDDMDVQVEDGLAGGRADVDSDIEAIGPVPPQNLPARAFDAIQERVLLLRSGIKPRRHMPARNDQSVPFRNRVTVPQPKALFCLKDDPGWVRGAKWAVAGHARGSSQAADNGWSFTVRPLSKQTLQ